MRSNIIARLINKFYQTYWFIFRPQTRGVKVLIFNEKKILMVRLTYYPNTWTFPGGGVHTIENPKEAVIRECYEEIGVLLKNPEFIGNLKFNHEYKNDTLSVFRESIQNTEIKIDQKEIAEANWFSLDNLPKMGSHAKNILDFALKN